MDAAALLRGARHDAGLTQRAVAAKAGVTQPVVAAYEAGRRQPTVPMLEKLLRACGRELDVRTKPARRLPDPESAGRELIMALDLADHIRRGRRALHEPLLFGDDDPRVAKAAALPTEPEEEIIMKHRLPPSPPAS